MNRKGFTLIEVVVAMGVFAVLMVGTSLLLISTLRGAKKAASQITVRSEGARVMDVISSSLRFSQNITDCTTGASISATLYDGTPISYSCVQASGTDAYLASGSGHLTSSGVTVSSCGGIFTCSLDGKTVQINFGLQKAGTNLQTEATSRIDFNAEVRLRN